MARAALFTLAAAVLLAGAMAQEAPDPRDALPFDEMDADSNGVLSSDEVKAFFLKHITTLKEMLKGNANPKAQTIIPLLESEALKLFTDADLNSDGDVDKTEYEGLVTGDAVKSFMKVVEKEVMALMMDGMGEAHDEM